MLRTDDSDSLAPVRSVSTGSSRAITPSKVAVRNTTPQRNTTPLRHGSANRERELTANASDVNVLKRHPSRSVSRRKQRQWENKNLFGLELLHKNIIAEELIDGHSEPHIQQQRYAFKIDWRSKFAELFQSSNHNELESFRTCLDITSASNVIYSHSNRKIRTDEWRNAEIAWLNVEKRLRLAMFRSLVTSEQFRLYVEALEITILAFLETGSVLGDAATPLPLKNQLLQPMQLDPSGNVELHLRDSSFHRLLLHGTCQFYGIKSKSVAKKSNQKEKVTVIYRPKRGLTEVAEDKVSLVGFLHASIVQSSTNISNSSSRGGEADVAGGLDSSLAEEMKAMLSLSGSGGGNSSAAPDTVSPEQIHLGWTQAKGVAIE